MEAGGPGEGRTGRPRFRQPLSTPRCRRSAGSRACANCTDEGGDPRFFSWRSSRARARPLTAGALTLPILVQLDPPVSVSAVAAAIQARERAAGWVIAQVEWKIPATPVLAFGALAVSGKTTGWTATNGPVRVRVLDLQDH